MPLKHIAFCLVLLCLTGLTTDAQAQSTYIEKKTDTVARKALQYLNNSQPDSVYEMAGKLVKSRISKQFFRNIYETQIAIMLPLKDMVFISSKNGINSYRLSGKTTLLSCEFGLDSFGRMEAFQFQPYQEIKASTPATELELETDRMAKKVLAWMNQENGDSIYMRTNEAFKRRTTQKRWDAFTKISLPRLLPLPDAVFLDSKDGVNKYRLGPYQLLLGLDAQGKINTLTLESFRADATKEEPVPSDNPLTSTLDSAIHTIMSPYIQTEGNVGASVAVYYRGKPYCYNYGEPAKGNKKLPTKETLYDIGSITKTFTTTLLAVAVVQKKLKLSTSITEFLPDSVSDNPSLKAITFGKLANHTSGLPGLPSNFESAIVDVNQPYERYAESNLYSYLKNYKDTNTSQGRYAYSNLGAGLLGVLLEKVFSESYAQLLERYILQPGNLHSTYVSLPAEELNVLAQGYNEFNLAVPAWKSQSMAGAGVLKSTAQDLLQYGILQLDTTKKDLLSHAIAITHRITHEEGFAVIGLGWHYFFSDKTLLNHGGATAGYRSTLYVDLAKNIVVVVLTNNATTGDKQGIKLIREIQAIR